MATIQDHLSKYREGPAQLRAAVQGMSREQVLARPVPGKWSTLEVLCHLADFEPIYADRMKRVISHDNPQLLAADENLFARHLHYQDRDAEEELRLIETTRSAMARILEKLSPEQFARSGTHNERGPVSLEVLVQWAGNHIPHHVPFILEKRKALGL